MLSPLHALSNIQPSSPLVTNSQSTQPTTSQSSTMSALGSGAKMLVKGATSAGIGGGISYGYLQRRDAISVFGMYQPEYLVDAALLGIESLTGDAIGNLAIPKLESMVSSNQTLQSVTKFAAPPTIVGLEHMAVKSLATDANNSKIEEFVLGAGTKLIADAAINSLLPQYA